MRLIKLSPLILILFAILFFFIVRKCKIPYREIDSYVEGNHHIKVLLDRNKMNCMFCDKYDIGGLKRDLCYVVVNNDKPILKFKVSDGDCGMISGFKEKKMYIMRDTLIFYIGLCHLYQINLPLDDKFHYLDSSNIIGYNRDGKTEDFKPIFFKDGSSVNVSGRLSKESIDLFLEYGIESYD